MSAQFGKCNFDGKPVDSRDFDNVRRLLAPYGRDGEGCAFKGNFGVLYRAFHTTRESRREVQPYLSKSGFVLTWDGRLDNPAGLIGQLACEISSEPTDLELVAAAYQCWGTEAFGRLIGDWALSVWNPQDQSLVLAKDFLGTRHLYYAVEKDEATWCTLLEPMVLLAEHSFELQEEYIAGWLALFPAPHLTPYVGIQAVPPSSFIRLTKGRRQTNKYWDFDSGKRIRYCADAEYEEHFRAVFSEAVRRRLRSDSPILAELSGGMDSSSIVCVADDLIAEGQEGPELNTVSYYNDSEPNWNERPYFAQVEARRGRPGYHIDTGSQAPLEFKYADECFAATPSSGGLKSDARKNFDAWVDQHSVRVVLSGIGGDEVTGGVPTPVPELADLIAGAHVGKLAHQLKLWALHKRLPWLFLLHEVTRRFLPPLLTTRSKTFPSWLQRDFAERHSAALLGYEGRLVLNGPAPSFQENLSTLEVLRRQLASLGLPADPTYETRYPFLDRDLLEFLFAVPRQQLVRPGQRRSLMRRALADTVPRAILERKRKAFVVRAPTIAAAMMSMSQTANGMICSQFRIVDEDSFAKNLKLVKDGYEVPIVPLARGLLIESWLKHVIMCGILKPPYVATNKRPATRTTVRSGVSERDSIRSVE